jgi:hypothetical protein
MFNRRCEINATLETMRRIGRKIKAAGSALNSIRPPERRF